MFVPKRAEIMVGRRKLQSEEVHKLNYSTNRVRVMKTRMRQDKQHTWERREGFGLENQSER
jgi:hypothetical protein